MVGFKVICSMELTVLIYLVGLLTLIGSSEIDDSFKDRLQIKKNQIQSITLSSAKTSEWNELIKTSLHLSEKQKVERVNNFFNYQISFASDINLWGINDYWSTLEEILLKGAGDCEDISIAKYFTLRKLGIAEDKIRLAYVRSLKNNLPHMVVTYSTSPKNIPYVLDNLNKNIKPANKRIDLIPIYSFNDSGLWLEKFEGDAKKVGYSSQLSMWTNLKKRM